MLRYCGKVKGFRRPAEFTDDIETCRGKTENNRKRPLGYASHALFHYLKGKLTIHLG